MDAKKQYVFLTTQRYSLGFFCTVLALVFFGGYRLRARVVTGVYGLVQVLAWLHVVVMAASVPSVMDPLGLLLLPLALVLRVWFPWIASVCSADGLSEVGSAVHLGLMSSAMMAAMSLGCGPRVSSWRTLLHWISGCFFFGFMVGLLLYGLSLWQLFDVGLWTLPFFMLPLAAALSFTASFWLFDYAASSCCQLCAASGGRKAIFACVHMLQMAPLACFLGWMNLTGMLVVQILAVLFFKWQRSLSRQSAQKIGTHAQFI